MSKEKEYQEGVVYQALQHAKETYSQLKEIYDGKAIAREMNKRIASIDKFMKDSKLN